MDFVVSYHPYHYGTEKKTTEKSQQHEKNMMQDQWMIDHPRPGWGLRLACLGLLQSGCRALRANTIGIWVLSRWNVFFCRFFGGLRIYIYIHYVYCILTFVGKKWINHVPSSGISILIFAACLFFLFKKHYVNLQEFIHQRSTS